MATRNLSEELSTILADASGCDGLLQASCTTIDQDPHVGVNLPGVRIEVMARRNVNHLSRARAKVNLSPFTSHSWSVAPVAFGPGGLVLAYAPGYTGPKSNPGQARKLA